VFDYGTKPSEDRRGSVVLQDDLKITEEDLEEIETKLGSMTLDATMDIMRQVLLLHEHDQNFPGAVLQKIKFFTQDEDVVANPAMHAELIREMKLEAILVTENSPYAEVRAVVDNTDDVDLPVGTPRAWFIGLLFVIGGAFINQLFAVRQPAITVTANVAQLLACESSFSCPFLCFILASRSIFITPLLTHNRPRWSSSCAHLARRRIYHRRHTPLPQPWTVQQ